MKTGKVVFNSQGNYYLETFAGSWFIPDSTVRAAWEAIQQDPEHKKVEYAKLAGNLARGILDGDVITKISYWIAGREWPDRSVYGETDGLCTCLESHEDVLSVIHDPNGWAITNGEIVARLNQVPELEAQVRQLEANVGGGDTAMRAMGQEVEYLQDEIERLKEGLQMIGQIVHGSTRWTRNIAMAVLGGTDCRVLEEVEKIGMV